MFNFIARPFSNGIEKLRSNLSCDIYEATLKDNRSCLLPQFLCRTKKTVLYGKNVAMFSNRRTSLPMPSITFPSLSYRRSLFDNNMVHTLHMNKLIKMLEQSSSVNKMVLCYRFLPGHSDYINHEFHINNQIVDRLKYISNTVRLSYNRVPFSVPELFPYTRKGAGISSLVNEKYDKVLVEVITFLNGEYGRFILLVSMGVSCTVWYIFGPGMYDIAPSTEIIPRVLSLDQFFQVDHHYDQFHKVCFLEQKSLTGEVLSAFENVFPFSEIDIPANSNVNVPSNSNVSASNVNESINLRVAVGLGLMVAVFLAMGIVPTSSSINEIEQR